MSMENRGSARRQHGARPKVRAAIAAATTVAAVTALSFVALSASPPASGLTGPPMRAVATSCTTVTQPLGAATGWTEFVEGSGHRGSESEGSIAWGGNLDASGMTVGTRLTSAAGTATLVVAGTHGQYFNLQKGSAYVSPKSGVNFNGGGTYLASNPVDFAAAFTDLRSRSTAWGSAAATGTAAPGTAGGNTVLVLTGTDPTLNVFSLTPAQLTSANGIGYDVPAGSGVLVNVSGSAVTLQGQVWIKQGGTYYQANDSVMESWPGILWNFPTATTVTMSVGSAWGGTILAPNAALTIASVGHTIGQMVAKTFSSNYETHQRLYPSSACLPPTTTTPPPSANRSDVRVVKTASSPAVHGGDTVTYTLEAKNVGLDDATGVVVRDALPTGVTFDSASSPCTQSSGVVSCSIGTLTPGQAKVLTVRVVADPIAGAGPAAHPMAFHELTPYKSEVQVDLDPGQTRTVTVACGAGDILGDGSLRVDHVDQGTGAPTDVRVLSSESTAVGTWKAVVRNDATGRAQAKGFVVCLPGLTEYADRQDGGASRHRHALSADAAVVATTQAWPAGRRTASVACPTGTAPVAPGFSLSGGAATLAGSEPAAGNGWAFTMDVAAPTTATLSVRCLRTTTSAVLGHTHDLVLAHVVRTVSVPAGATVEEQVTCADQAKGVVGTWSLPAGVQSLGNDPRLKARAFRLLNTTAAAQTATVDLECLGDRTTVETRGTVDPLVVVNTATVTSTSVDADPGNNSSTASVTVQPGSTTASVAPLVVARPSRLGVRIVSSMPGSGFVVVRSAGRDGRVLARGRVDLLAGTAQRVHLRLTAAGRRVEDGARAWLRIDPTRGPGVRRPVVVTRPG
ncbi:choice-of-anchor A family protein [Nocardioides sp. KIGAM211]|uniref:Choice-of-anchor A family protein n=1 Tax=Nocardioides luti TaxID=2761101 RepID=A0A7X0VD01_9ACTN|nr:choice-of-anchor A family protein [Nocardioides luti]MBB6628783.1 choice-of-anchor A family protein [Nocardioides luti]